jgi:hypothetical protein
VPGASRRKKKTSSASAISHMTVITVCQNTTGTLPGTTSADPARAQARSLDARDGASHPALVGDIERARRGVGGALLWLERSRRPSPGPPSCLLARGADPRGAEVRASSVWSLVRPRNFRRVRGCPPWCRRPVWVRAGSGRIITRRDETRTTRRRPRVGPIRGNSRANEKV